MTADLQEVAQDKHLRVSAPGPAPVPADDAAPLLPPRSEGGVTRADRLSGDIGYIDVVGFPSLAVFKSAVDQAMASLEDTEALIIDVRRNGGGSPESVSNLVSYFLDAGAEPVKINEFFMSGGYVAAKEPQVRRNEFHGYPLTLTYRMAFRIHPTALVGRGRAVGAQCL
ncbi:MAG: hypothetical protein GEU90_04290 [Gemmatimonas sp.]|nr:hypothetical protein [Gemmatimonas sp.]